MAQSARGRVPFGAAMAAERQSYWTLKRSGCPTYLFSPLPPS
jgi:hypothetical protein